MYFSDNLQLAKRSIESVKAQIPIVKALFDKTLSDHPDYCCKRATINKLKPKGWQTFFVEFPRITLASYGLRNFLISCDPKLSLGSKKYWLAKTTPY
jgi:hypothetical protein